MIFIILTVVAILGILAVNIFWVMEEGPFGLLPGLGIAVLIAGGWLFVYGGCWLIEKVAGEHYESSSQSSELRALTASSSIEGHFFFLGGGYVDGKRVLNYIVQQDGYSTLEQVNADESRVYEDESRSPYVAVKEFSVDWWWLLPGPQTVETRYDFHIPEDSILENYTIDNS